MSGTYDIHTETESEDGGVPVTMFESSDEVESDHDSAPTSTSESPTQPSYSIHDFGIVWSPPTFMSLHSDNTDSHTMQSTISTPSTMDLPPIPLQDTTSHTPIMDSASLNETSFAQALSGSLLNVSETMEYLPTEDVLSPTSEPPGMPQSYPSLVDVIEDTPPVQTGEDVVAGQDQSPAWHMAPNVDVQDPNLSLPSLTDIFGSDWLMQHTGPFQIAHEELLLDFQVINADFADCEDSIRNFHCDAFFHHWKNAFAHKISGYPRISDLANTLDKVQRPERISADILDSENADIQGILWSRFQTSKKEAREVRRMTYTNHTNPTAYCLGYRSNVGQFGTPTYKTRFSEDVIPNSDIHFQFREMNTRFESYLSHFQLRHNIFASSKNALFYNRRPRENYGYGYSMPGVKPRAKIMCFNPGTGTDECAMDLTIHIDKNRDIPRLERPTTLTADHGVLVIGSFEGVFALKSLGARFESRPTTGVICSNGDNGSTNHIHNFLDRNSGLPQAAFSSNDMSVRVLDCTTSKMVRAHFFPYQINCSATSPDGRLRLLVGDGCDPIVSNAETGEVLAKLPDHTNFGFACAWAPDSITMATGHQDGFVQVWDARRMTESIARLPMEMSGCRTLQFSPLGGGKRTLVIAEPADFVHVVDAQTYGSKQVIEFFGEIAGISITPDGQKLYVANQDPRYGGLMEFDRASENWGKRRTRRTQRIIKSGDMDQALGDEEWQRLNQDNAEHSKDNPAARRSRRPRSRFKASKGLSVDWLPEEDLDDDDRVVRSRAQRERQGLDIRGLDL